MGLSKYKLLVDKRCDFVDCDIVVRTYNEAGNVIPFIRSIKKNNNVRVNFIFLDSGSDDGTLELLKSQDVTIFTIEKEFFNFGETLDFLFSCAKSEWVFSFSAHVGIKGENVLEKSIYYMKKYNAVSGYMRQMENEKNGCSILEKIFIDRCFYKTDKPVIIKGTSQIPSNAAAVYRKEAWEKCRFGIINGSEDKNWARENYKKGATMIYIGNIVVEHSHNEHPSKYYKRMLMNYREQHRMGVKRNCYIQFIKVFLGIMCFGMKFCAFDAFEYAKANYRASKEIYK